MQAADQTHLGLWTKKRVQREPRNASHLNFYSHNRPVHRRTPPYTARFVVITKTTSSVVRRMTRLIILVGPFHILPGYVPGRTIPVPTFGRHARVPGVPAHFKNPCSLFFHYISRKLQMSTAHSTLHAPR